MNINSIFPSNYLKADDLQGKEYKITINRCTIEKVGEDNRLVIYFNGTDKGLICNKTNAQKIAFYYGEDTDGWLGKQIVLYPDLVNFQGKVVPALRVRVGNSNGGKTVQTGLGGLGANSQLTSQLRPAPTPSLQKMPEASPADWKTGDEDEIPF